MTEAVRKELEAEVAKLDTRQNLLFAKLQLQDLALKEIRAQWSEVKNSKEAIKGILNQQEAA